MAQIKISALSVFFILVSSFLYAEDTYTLTGIVVDKESNKPIPGATIKTTDNKKGTYSSPSGKFRLPFLRGKVRIKVSSIGYESNEVEVKGSEDIKVGLKPAPVNLKNVNVIGDIDADQIIKRAIERKENNLKKLHTFQGLLYSKLKINFAGSIIGAAAGGGAISLGAGLGKKPDDSKTTFIFETFSNIYRDYDKNVKFTNIIQRHQTANLKPQDNIMAIGDFLNFYDDRVKIINAEIATPLAKDAFSFYSYELIGKSLMDERFVYIISVKPASSVYPAFEGTIKIIEGSYNLIELDLQPGKNTGITFFDSIHFNEKFSEIHKEIWHPSYFEVNANGKFDLIKGLLDVSGQINAVSIFNETKINEALPDSIYNSVKPRNILVAKDADSAKKEFWEKNSLRELSPVEQKIYTTIDSLVAIRDTVNTNKSPFDWSLLPDLEFNRVGSVILGLNPTFYYNKYRLSALGQYSFGLQKPLGVLNLTIPIVDTSYKYYEIYGNVFSELGTVSRDKSYSKLINSLMAAIFHVDYYDNFRRDGWSTGFFTRLFGIKAQGEIEFSRQFSLRKNTNRSIFADNIWRENKGIEDGPYRTANGRIEYGAIQALDLNPSFQYNVSVSALYGENTITLMPFRLIEGSLNMSIPTFPTGYAPMNLSILVNGGIASMNTPIQYQFRQPAGLVFIGIFGNFYSAPIDVPYGGTQYYAVHLKYNFTDLWWRALHLPLYNGRGLELLTAFSSGKYFSGDEVPGKIMYNSTSPNFYTEAGVGLGKIPTFISNVIFLSLDARWGIGPIAKGRFGWGISLSSPF